MLAEIADKMGTAASWWILASFLTVPFVYLAIRVPGKLGMAAVLAFAGGLSILLTFAAVRESFFEGEFSFMVQDELGSPWLAHRIASGCLPLVLTSIVLGLKRRWAKRDHR